MADSGPYFTPDGKCYYMLGGRSVWASQHTGTSSGEQAHSVAEEYYARGEIRQSSWPLQSPPSNMKARLTSGYPTTRFGGGQSQGSAPSAESLYRDPYRDAVNPEKNPRGPPLNSPFMEDFNEYKDHDTAADAAETAYKNYLKTAPSVSRKLRSKTPGLYNGEPLATKEWHATAARYAYRAGKCYEQASKDRNGMGERYVGYDTPVNAVGHATRADQMMGSAGRFMKKYRDHKYSHGTGED